MRIWSTLAFESVNCAETCQIDGYRIEHGLIAVALQLPYIAVCAETSQTDGYRTEHGLIAVALQMPYIAVCAETCFFAPNKTWPYSGCVANALYAAICAETCQLDGYQTVAQITNGTRET